MGSHGFPWVPWGPMGSHGAPWGPMGPHGVPWGPHGAPMASMENPRMSEIIDFNENHYSVRQKIGDAVAQIDPQYISAPSCHIKTA